MAQSKCGGCGGTNFELEEERVAKATYKMYFVQCTKCGVAVGVVPYFDAGTLVRLLAEKLGHRF